MRALYEIDFDIENCFDPETGEIFEDRLEELQVEREKKLEGVALGYKNLMAEAEMIKAEIKSLTERQKRAEAKAEGLKGYLDRALGGAAFTTPKAQIKYRRSTALEIMDESDIPDEYWKVKTEKSVDKLKIKDAMKSGIEVPGVELQEKLNISIK